MVEVVSVDHKREWSLFQSLDPCSIDSLNLQKNPFFHHGYRRAFLAFRDKTPVGRIVVMMDDHYNQEHQVLHGFFGFFYCRGDLEAARALMKRGEEWLRERGTLEFLGPIELSFNRSFGLVVGERADDESKAQSRLLESLGYQGAKDFYSFQFSEKNTKIDQVQNVCDQLRHGSSIKFQTMDREDFKQFLQKSYKIYQESYQKRWGSVKMDFREWSAFLSEEEQLLHGDLMILGSLEDQVVGFGFAVPDSKRKEKTLSKIKKVFALNVKKEVPTERLLYAELIKRCLKSGYARVEIPRVEAEDNEMISFVKTLSGEKLNTYRIYKKLG